LPHVDAMDDMRLNVMNDELNCPTMCASSEFHKENTSSSTTMNESLLKEETKEGKNEDVATAINKTGGTKEEEANVFGSHGILSHILPNNLVTKQDLLEFVENAEKKYNHEKEMERSCNITINDDSKDTISN
jgi:hypothetical protein